MQKKKRSLITRPTDLPPEVSALALSHGIDPAGIRAWKLYPGGRVVFIAANGMKFIHEPEVGRPEVGRPDTGEAEPSQDGQGGADEP
jgi:hypothetical protein